MINPVILIGEPLDFQEKIKIYPPRVKDVVANPNFNIYYKILTLTQDDVKDEVKDKLKEGDVMPTPLDYIMLNAQYVQGFANLLREAFKFFCHTDIGFLFEERKIIIGNVEELVQNIKTIDELVYLTEKDFFDF